MTTDDTPGRSHRASGALLLALVVALSPGCSATPAGGDLAGGDEGVGPAKTVGPVGSVDPAEPVEAPQTGVEERGPQPQEEAASAEEPAQGGGGRVAVELAGLPVGGGEVLAVDGTWCQVLFWGSVPDDVWLDIDSVRIKDEGGTLLQSGCDASPPCAGVRISADEPGGCAVVVRPASPDIAFVQVQLNGTLSCPDQASCDALGATDGSWTRIANPVVANPVVTDPEGSDPVGSDPTATDPASPGTG